jgi:hypothetical protein
MREEHWPYAMGNHRELGSSGNNGIHFGTRRMQR